MPPQQSSADADARKLGLTVEPADQAPASTDATDPDSDARKLGLTSEPAETNLQKGMTGAGIRAEPFSARASEYIPLAGGFIGGLLGDVPGAFAGGMIGERLKQYVNALTGFRNLPTPADATADEVESGVGQGAMELGGKAVGKVLGGVVRPTAPADIALAKANQNLGLRLSPADMINKTATGMVGQAVDQMAERSVSGRVIGDLNRQVTSRVARDGIVDGKAALNQVGDALHQVVTSGPAYDMFPHRIEAAQIFATDVAPKILDLYAKKLTPELTVALKSAVNGGLSPDLAQSLIPKIRRVIQRGQSAPVPTGTLDALESILQTADTASFDSASKLRTSLIEIGRRDDAVMGDRGKALTKKFSGDLTQGMSAAYPPWDPLRQLYATGARNLRLPNVASDIAAANKADPGSFQTAVSGKTGTIQAGTEPDVLANLRTIDDALSRVRKAPGAFGNNIYRIFELSSAAGLAFSGHPVAAMGSLGVSELLPGLMVWAAHNPTMTKLVQEGLTTRDLSKASTLLGRVTQAYITERDQAQRQKAASQGPTP